MAKTLDKTRPFATVHGDTTGRAFEQDTAFFHQDGSLWTDPAEVAAKEAEEAVKAAAKK